MSKALPKLAPSAARRFRPLSSLLSWRSPPASRSGATSRPAGGALGLVAVLAFVLHALRLVDRLEGSEQRLKVVLDTMSDGLVVADMDGNFLIFNEAAEKHSGKGRCERRPNGMAESLRHLSVRRRDAGAARGIAACASD